MRDTILAVYHERGDAWSETVQARLLHVHDLHTADAKSAAYHWGSSQSLAETSQMTSQDCYHDALAASFQTMLV